MKSKKFNNTFVNLTYVCNNNCISCIMENHYHENLGIKEISEQINNILNYSNHIEFNGGEPTLRKDIFKILDYTNKKKKNIEIGLITNSRIFNNEKFVIVLSNLKIKNFKIITSIYGHNPDLHDAITRAPNSFIQQINGIKNLIKHNIKIELRIIINKMNYIFLNDISTFLINNFKKNDFISINFVNTKIIGQALKNKNNVVSKNKLIIPNLIKSVNKLSSNFNIKISHFPNCLLPIKFYKYSLGMSAEDSEIIFLRSCSKCSEKSKCSGIWKSYYKLYGGKEFKIIK